MNNVSNTNENMAVCSRCGKPFDTSVEGMMNTETYQHMCAACYRKTFETNSIGRTLGNIILIVLGGFLIAGGLLNIADGDMETVIFGVASGLVLLAFWIIPAIAKKNKAKKWKNIVAVKAADVYYWSCSHCGANTCGAFCEYCDSPYEGKKRK